MQSCPFKLIAWLHTYLFDSLIDLISIYVYLNININKYIYIYMCVCVCVCVESKYHGHKLGMILPVFHFSINLNFSMVNQWTILGNLISWDIQNKFA